MPPAVSSVGGGGGGNSCGSSSGSSSGSSTLGRSRAGPLSFLTSSFSTTSASSSTSSSVASSPHALSHPGSPLYNMCDPAALPDRAVLDTVDGVRPRSSTWAGPRRAGAPLAPILELDGKEAPGSSGSSHGSAAAARPTLSGPARPRRPSLNINPTLPFHNMPIVTND